jgi:NAD(P)-dependent dehydrogenase (short-subunit alcohol dehydrogenase family)
VKDACPDPSVVVVLPFDLLGAEADLQAAAQAADAAFGGAGVDFLIHNAGRGALCMIPLHRTANVNDIQQERALTSSSTTQVGRTVYNPFAQNSGCYDVQ